MSRGFTPEELAEYNERRRKELEENAPKLGLSLEERERIYREALREHSTPAGKEQTEAALRAALEKIASGFVDSLKTDTMRGALNTAQDVDSMSEEQFSNLLAERMSVLDEEERREAAKVVARKIACWHGGEDEPISLREEILIELQSMIKRHNYYAGRS